MATECDGAERAEAGEKATLNQGVGGFSVRPQLHTTLYTQALAPPIVAPVVFTGDEGRNGQRSPKDSCGSDFAETIGDHAPRTLGSTTLPLAIRLIVNDV